jgi:hypothetical protein
VRVSQALLGHYRLFKHMFGIRHCLFTALAGKKEHYFFENGWGDEDSIRQLSDEKLSNAEAQSIDISWTGSVALPGGSQCKRGTFLSPMPKHLLHPQAHLAHVELYEPKDVTLQTPLVIVFAMTGDEGFEFRYKTLSKDLLKMGISTLLLENSYYGLRKPQDQLTYRLPTVQDMLSMSVATVQEGKSLLKYFRTLGHTRLGVAGVSQGAMVAALVGAQAPFPVAIASSLAAHAPDIVLNEGLLSCFVEWPALFNENDVEIPQVRLKDLFKVGDITLFPPPKNPKSAFLLGARRDVVIPKESVKKIHRHWPESHLKWIPGTHVTSIFFHSRAFRKLVFESISSL